MKNTKSWILGLCITVIGAFLGGTFGKSLGAAIGAAMGYVAGALIAKYMDKD